MPHASLASVDAAVGHSVTSDTSDTSDAGLRSHRCAGSGAQGE